MLRELQASIKFAEKALKTGILQIANKLPDLYGLVFEVTDKCTSRCRHCNIWQSKPTKNLLTPEEIEEVFSDTLFKDLKYIIITGGEPVLRNDLEDIILTIHKILPNTRITLSTNGLLPHRVINVVKTLIKNNMCFDVGVSLDGIGDKHDFIRGVKGNFEKVDYLLHNLLELRKDHEGKLNIAVGHTLSNLTCDSLLETEAYAQKLNLPFFTQLCEEFSYYSNLNNTKQTDNSELIKSVQRLPLSIHNEKLLKALKSRRPVKFQCFSMKTFFLLKCNGDVAPCLRYSNHNVMNIREYSPTEIWQSSAAKEARDIVENCEGCSNTWATGWSLDNWFLSFLGLLIRYKLKKEIAQLRINNTSAIH